MNNANGTRWAEILEDLESSGLSRKKYADLKGINIHTLNYHVRNKRETALARKSKASEFIQIPLKDQSEKCNPEITLTFSGKTLTIKIGLGS